MLIFTIQEQCLKADESCPSGFYMEFIGLKEEGALKSLTGKSVSVHLGYLKLLICYAVIIFNLVNISIYFY